MVLHPMEGQSTAIETANKFIGTPYDFDYKSDKEKIYCFELVSKCYPQSGMKEYTVKKFFGLLKRKCYLAKSIYNNVFFRKLWEKCKEKREVSSDIIAIGGGNDAQKQN